MRIQLYRLRLLISVMSARIELFFTIRLRWFRSDVEVAAPVQVFRTRIVRPEPLPLRELPVVEDIERLYVRQRHRITNRKPLWKAAKVFPEFRGIVHFTSATLRPLYTIEFFFPGTTVLLLFLDLDEHEEHAVRLVTTGRPYDADALCALLGSFLNRLENRLLPKEAHAGDG
jgi:hypothetical protein